MDYSTLIKIIILIVLLCLSAFFSSAETALTTVSQIRMKTLADDGDKRASAVLRITENSAKMLSAILIGNNVVNLSASSLSTALAIQFFGSKAAGIATGILTFLILIFGEITPKTMATMRAEKMSLRICYVIQILMVVLTPVIFIINAISYVILRLLGVKKNEKRAEITEEDLRTIVDVSHESGVIEHEERVMINKLFDFGDAKVREAMIPRIDMTAIDVEATHEEVLETFRKDKYTRIPVYEENPDHIIGILNMKDVLLSRNEDVTPRDILREAYFTYESKNTSELFMEMKESSINFAVVLDEYGATAGIITLEDLLEEIVGEIRDEYDYDEEDPIRKISDTEYIVDASMNLEDLAEELDIKLESEEYDSLGGYLMQMLDHIPRVRESFTTPEGVYMEVRRADGRRLRKIYLKLSKSEQV